MIRVEVELQAQPILCRSGRDHIVPEPAENGTGTPSRVIRYGTPFRPGFEHILRKQELGRDLFKL